MQGCSTLSIRRGHLEAQRNTMARAYCRIITYSACALTVVAVMVCRAYCKVDRIDVPHCPAVIMSSFANALIKNSSKLPLMSPELRNVHRTNSMFFSAHNFPTGPSSLARSCDRIYQSNQPTGIRTYLIRIGLSCFFFKLFFKKNTEGGIRGTSPSQL